MTTSIIFAAGEQHTQVGHPEHAGRLGAIRQFLEASGILEQVLILEPKMATDEDILRVHSADQINLVRWVSQRGGGMIGGDTYTTVGTFDAAKLAAGAACQAVDSVLTGKADNSVALIRPPGHHASESSIEGFCLFNNVAIAARYAQTQHNVERIAIVDFDVHHGNGTQNIFYADSSVQFFSIHMFSHFFYPGSGHLLEDGVQQGLGYTINAPLPPGTGDRGYQAVFDQIVTPLLTDFQPELILVSAGFDAHWRDPLAQMQLSLQGYAAVMRHLIRDADALCGGKIVFVLEGGYDLDVLGYSILNLIHALLKNDVVLDPIGAAPDDETDVSDLLIKVKQLHLLA
jgi:acetoin utilization deacetylase AcuC-like enzyme